MCSYKCISFTFQWGSKPLWCGSWEPRFLRLSIGKLSHSGVWAGRLISFGFQWEKRASLACELGSPFSWAFNSESKPFWCVGWHQLFPYVFNRKTKQIWLLRSHGLILNNSKGKLSKWSLWGHIEIRKLAYIGLEPSQMYCLRQYCNFFDLSLGKVIKYSNRRDMIMCWRL